MTIHPEILEAYRAIRKPGATPYPYPAAAALAFARTIAIGRIHQRTRPDLVASMPYMFGDENLTAFAHQVAGDVWREHYANKIRTHRPR